MNGLHLKLYHAWLMIVEKDEENERGETMPLKNVATLDVASLTALFVAVDRE